MSRMIASCTMVLVALCGCASTAEQVEPGPSADASASQSVSVPAIVMVGANGAGEFSPANVTIRQGDLVRWVWSDATALHTVTSGQPGAPDGQFCSLENRMPMNVMNCSGGYARTAPFQYVRAFQSAGTFRYYSLPNDTMTGVVTVIPADVTVPN